MAAAAPPDLPVRFIAFGAEEPRGSGDALHHFGSQQHVDDLSRAERRAIKGVVALDRVGVRASSVPVCSARASGNDLRADVRAAARKVDVPHPSVRRQHHQRPLVVREGGCPGDPAGQRPVRRLSLPRRHPRGGGPPPDRPGRHRHVGLAAEPVTDSRAGDRHRAYGPRLVDHTSSRIFWARSPFTTRGTKRESSAYGHRLDRLHLVAPQHDLDEDPLHRLGLEVHVEDEVAERVHDHGIDPSSPSPAPSGDARRSPGRPRRRRRHGPHDAGWLRARGCTGCPSAGSPPPRRPACSGRRCRR